MTLAWSGAEDPIAKSKCLELHCELKRGHSRTTLFVYLDLPAELG